jgi:2,3-dihydroxybenzoate decarboxylase
LWSAVESLGAPLYLHPGAPPADRWRVIDGRPELYGATWSWAAEVSGHALRLVFGGVFDRHPGATLILGHMGEFLPFQRSRLDSRYATIATATPLKRVPSAHLGTNVVFTNSGVFSPAVMLGAVLEVGADAVMFSVDYSIVNVYTRRIRSEIGAGSIWPLVSAYRSAPARSAGALSFFQSLYSLGQVHHCEV